MNVAKPLWWADADDPTGSRMIFVAAVADPVCDHHRRALVAACELYQGGHTRVPPSTRPMTEEQARRLRPEAGRALQDEMTRHGVPRQVMMIADHPYEVVVSDVYGAPGLPPHTTLHTPYHDAQWPLVAAVLDGWGWP